MMDLSVQEVVEKCPQFHSLPEIYNRLNAAINNPHSSIRTVSDIISTDAGISLKLLKLVNSAFYGYPSEIDSISKAVVLVGTKQLRDLVLATSVMRTFKNIPAELINLEDFWKYSISCGVGAKIMGFFMKERNQERLFVSGILHDVGRLVMLNAFPREMTTTINYAKDEKIPLIEAEKKFFGFDHAQVGNELISLWNLPSCFNQVTAYHNRPLSSANFPKQTSVIHIAEILSHLMQHGFSGEYHAPKLSSKAWETAGLPNGIMNKVISQLDQQYHEVVNTLLN